MDVKTWAEIETEERLNKDVEIKQRLCLMCEQPFESTWSGNRICSKCKSSTAYRLGNQMSG